MCVFITARICGELMFLLCLFVYASVWAVTFEADGIETFVFSTVVDEYHI